MSETTEEHRQEAPEKLGFTVITVSDSRYNSLKDAGNVDDVSGKLILDTLQSEGMKAVKYTILPDNKDLIATKVSEIIKSRDSDVIILTGGTGISSTDVTIEALEGIIEKRIDGFSELFRRASYDEIGGSVMLTRVTAGVNRGVVIFAVPGSPNAVETALEIIKKELKHLVKHARE